MKETEKLFIETEEVKLESEYFKSDTSKTPLVLLTHPHPGYGGTMHNNVVSELFRTLVANDISCLRFNFIGVGRSQGKGSGTVGPISQVEACIDFLVSQNPDSKLLISGYSYGAAIGCSAVNHSEKIIGFIAVSFPWDFMGSKYKELSQTSKPKFFIQGDRDNIAQYSNFHDHYEDYKEPKSFEIISGANHFYRGYEREISQIALGFYNELP